jgi:hypothetical protein
MMHAGNTPAHPVVVLPICPRPSRSAIPIARAKLRQTLANGGTARPRRYGARSYSRPAAREPNELAVHPGSRSIRGDAVYAKFLIVVYSPEPCTLAGVPAVAAIGPGAKAIEVARSVPHLHTTRRHNRVVTLEAGRPALFFVAHRDATGRSRCRSAVTHALRMRPPGMRWRTVVNYRISFCPSPRGGLGLQVRRIE